MPLLLTYRRWWLVLFAAILALPTLGLLLPDLPGPVRPVTKVQEKWWIRATEGLDPFINAHFGFRGVVMAANASFARATHSTRSRPVVVGDGGQLYFTGDQTLEQSLGLVMRSKPIADLVDVVTRLDARLQAKGIKLVVAVPPNGATMLPGRLPGWGAGADAPSHGAGHRLRAPAAERRDLCGPSPHPGGGQGRRRPDLPAHRHPLDPARGGAGLQCGDGGRRPSRPRHPPGGSQRPAGAGGHGRSLPDPRRIQGHRRQRL